MKKILMVLVCLPLFATGQTSTHVSLVKVDERSTVKFVEDYQYITSFDEVLKKFEGRTVYIDLWATWCGPCIAQFEYKDDLNAFVQEHDIDVLYISVDQDGDDEKWSTFIKEKQLTGYHMRASKALGDDIRELFSQEYGGRKAFGIPYYIIAKNGEVVMKKAPRPSSKEVLYNELKKYK